MIMFAGTLLNAALAIVNASVFSVSGVALMVIQAAITAAAVAVVVRRASLEIIPVVVATVILLVFLGFGAINHGFSVKDANDILLIPIFLAVGVVAPRFPKKAFLWIFSLVSASAILEAVSITAYTAIFSPLSYLVNTRVWIAESVTKANLDRGLYLGADRGGGLIFSFLADHRVGGLFLEPLSLGYFAVVSAMVFATMYKASFGKLAAGIAACLFLAMISDSRLGTGLILLFWLVAMAPAYVLPRWVAYLVPVLILFVAFLVFSFQLANGSGDTMDRLAITIAEVGKNPLSEFIQGNVSVDRFGDSAVLRIMYNTTLFECIFALIFYSGVFVGKFRGHTYVPTLAGTYITSSALFGGAFMSIKTVALFGIYVGVVATGRFNGAAASETIGEVNSG